MEDDELTSAAEQRTGTIIAKRFRLLRLIGVGGMGGVYEAAAANGARVAVKVLHRSAGILPGVRERFFDEARIASCIDHPGIVRIFDHGVSEEGDPYLAMELLEGQSIEERAQQTSGILPVNEVLAITAAALDILDAAHAAGVVHRDLKPENLFLATGPALKMLDFGIARMGAPDKFVKRTRTGIIMGTPAFMAPEQAKGSWGDVDTRTDIWAMGAIMFNLLTGRPVHEGGEITEVLIAAAMRPARSLARMMPHAPLALVRIVDRALSFEQRERYPDAAQMRAEIVESAPEIHAAAESAASASVLGNADTMKPAPKAEAEAGDAFAVAQVSDEERAALESFFSLVERALVISVQYGSNHPETQKRLSLAVKHAIATLDRSARAIAWNVTPYSFAAGGKPLWEPRAPLDRVPYQLFADGVRLIALAPGLSEEEFGSLLRILMLDRAREMAPEDDFVTLLWEADFPHVSYQAIDTFAEGDQNRRSLFENDVRGVEAIGRISLPGQVADCWNKRGDANLSAEAHNARLLVSLQGGDRATIEAVVSAEAMLGRGGAMARRTALGAKERALALGGDLVRVLDARLRPDAAATNAKFMKTVALAWVEARAANATEGLILPLRGAIDGVATNHAGLALSTAAAMSRTVGPRYPDFSRAIVSPKTLGLMLTHLASAPDPAGVGDVRTLFGAFDAAHMDAVIAALPEVTDESLKDVLLEYLGRSGVGNEGRLGALFAVANEHLGLAVIRVLVKIGSAEAKSAILRASSSPHAVVRIEALGHVEGAASERLRLELKALLEDADGNVRLAALRTIGQHGVRVAGPSLVLRIRGPKFDALPFDERRQALETLAALAPRRAEEVCVELLANAGIIPSESREQSRLLAVELLARIGGSEESREALGAAASARWRNSDRLRAAAGNALSRPPPPPSAPSVGPPRKPTGEKR